MISVSVFFFTFSPFVFVEFYLVNILYPSDLQYGCFWNFSSTPCCYWKQWLKIRTGEKVLFRPTMGKKPRGFNRGYHLYVYRQINHSLSGTCTCPSMTLLLSYPCSISQRILSTRLFSSYFTTHTIVCSVFWCRILSSGLPRNCYYHSLPEKISVYLTMMIPDRLFYTQFGDLTDRV